MNDEFDNAKSDKEALLKAQKEIEMAEGTVVGAVAGPEVQARHGWNTHIHVQARLPGKGGGYVSFEYHLNPRQQAALWLSMENAELHKTSMAGSSRPYTGFLVTAPDKLWLPLGGDVVDFSDLIGLAEQQYAGVAEDPEDLENSGGE